MRNSFKILIMLLVPVLSNAQQHYVDSLKNILKTARADSTRYSALNGLGEYYVEVNRDSALLYLDKAFYIAKKNNKNLNAAVTIARKGYVLEHLGTYPESLQCFQQALDLSSDSAPVVTTWNPNMSWLSLSTPDKNRLSILAGIRLQYCFLIEATGDHTQSITQLKLSHKYATDAGNTGLLGVVNMNLGAAYFKQNLIDSALILAKDAERIAIKTGYNKYQAYIECLLGRIYLKKGNDSLALQFYHRSLTTSLKQKASLLLDNVYRSLADYYIAIREKDSSLYYAAKRLNLVRQMASDEIDGAYEDMYKSYQLANNTDSAYKYLGLALAANKINDKTTIKNLADFQKLSMQQQLSLQKLQKETEDAETRIRMYALFVVIIIVLIVAFFIYRNSRQRKKANYLLQEQKEEIAAQRDNLTVKNHELEIETALEKVRTVALAMQQPDDMLEVCRTICAQLVLLGVPGIRNVQTAIIYESRGIYMNYEYYRLYDKTFITETDYSHPMQANFVKKMLVDGAYQSLTLAGNELKDWLDYQKTTNQFIDMHLAEVELLNYNWFSIGPVALGMSLYKQISEENLLLFKRFLEVFRLAYRRYKDVELALAQAREAKIETALERVRSRSLGMQKSDELKEVIQNIFEQFVLLGIDIEHTGFVVDYVRGGDWHFWVADHLGSPNKLKVANYNGTWNRSFDEAKVNGSNFFTTLLNFEEKNQFYRDLFANAPGDMPPETQQVIFGKPGLAASTVLLTDVALYIENFSGTPYTDEENATLMRFGKVFQQTYTRFLDLQKAEAQAREGQIQLALERVRARTMAMQHSDELSEASHLLDSQVRALGINTWGCAFNIYGENDATEWFGNETGIFPFYKVPLEGIWRNYYEHGQKGELLFVQEITGEVCKAHYEYMLTLPVIGDMLKHIRESGASFPLSQIDHVVYFKYGHLMFITMEPVPEAYDIFKRFAKVFEQTYTRFLDLQKAEAQAREGQVQLALERIRARTMAMQHSDELLETTTLLSQQFYDLGTNALQISIGIVNEQRGMIELSATLRGVPLPQTFDVRIDQPMVMAPSYKAWKEGKRSIEIVIKGEQLREYNKMRNRESDNKFDFEGKGIDAQWIVNTVFFTQGMLTCSTDTPVTEETRQLLARFGNVFEQTYTRFLDLQKAEAQAKEGQIQLALERVRARTMAMQHSDELSETVYILFQQFKELGENPDQATIGIINEDEWVIEYWVTMYGSQINRTFKFSIDEPNVTNKIYNGWKAGEKSLVIDLQGDELRNFSAYRAAKGGAVYKEGEQRRIVNVAFFAKGLINVQSAESHSAESIRLLERFAAVFEGTYQRFLDLQKAEAQTREALVEAALERVRSKTMAMHNSNDVGDAMATMFDQMLKLGAAVTTRSGIAIIDGVKHMQVWTAYNNNTGKVDLITGKIDMSTHQMLAAVYDKWKVGETHSTHTLEGDDQRDYYRAINHAEDYGVQFKLSDLPERQFQNAFYFPEGFLYVFSPEQLSRETVNTFKRFASVFGLTYRRFLDLQKAEALAEQAQHDLVLLQTEKKRAEDALTELKAAQTKLIQTEKMASLGELTAGIAHEIQNPLNFVNNFSEVSVELLTELKEEIEAGNTEDVIAIASDLTQNLEKIRHHGKRADFIVKGMLQHSRTSTGEKQPTDINLLADEFLKLSYHGLRAKDKNFNAELITSFDKNLSKLNIAQQEIGRVLLNLFNNAFYAVNQKKKTAGPDYKPEVTVTVSAHPSGGGVIVVRDNGNGIPDAIKDKIMQPFFTTKPTGEGTGLGLSLSYDIVVKGHGGKIEVNTKEGEGSEFIVYLPVHAI